MSDVYLVGLTEEDRAELEHLARHQWAYSTPRNRPHAKRRVDILESARPEHPERQSALEELGRVAELYRDGGSSWVELAKAVDAYRSLEGK